MTLDNSLSVLYIEDNIDDQLILRRTLKRNIKADINFDTATTAAEGLNKLNSNDYDLVFLDYKLPDKTGIEFLDEIRAVGMTVPVIFLTGMGSEKVAIQAMRAGVEEYIIKSDIQTSEFIEIIRKRLLKQMEQSSPLTELTEIEEEILQEIQGSNISHLNLELVEDSLVYNGLGKFVKKKGLEVTSKVLDQLNEKGILKEIGISRQIICPACNSFVTGIDNYNYSCTSCLSKNIMRVNILSHPFCGYTGDRRAFVTDSGLVCPNCKIPLKNHLNSQEAMDKEGYLKLGSAFECADCETRFNQPEMLHTCGDCGEKFGYKNMGYISVKEYEVV